MAKTVYVIRDDMYHPKEVIDPQIDKAFDRAGWNVVSTDRLRDVLESQEPIDLTVLLTVGRPDGEADIAYAEQQRIVDKVKDGMGILFVHAGLVLIEADSPYYTELNSGRFIGHSHNHVPVDNVPIRNVSHPVLNGISGFTAMDEHYYCQIDIARTDMLMLSTSEAVTAVGAWAHNVGKGRVVGMTPGHTTEALGDPQMIRLLQNAAKWATESR
ncbi:ThuA domain-containing protein [Cohnella nanjingensis]|uniref:ThuA domain-containing protein n=1 Tax=Cohnella nanjingensis TaxID=1387779 RepID=A0A7X0RNN4_9BACL|nr:ThuA domain-containing protein [Cohnella nanjingensis]MBB6669691.1 ThuA domain-containing protein [Cohnella nanjingensis]